MPTSHSHSTNGAVVGEHRRLPRGPHREDSWGLKMVLGSRGTAGTSSSPPIWLSTAPASSCQLCQASYLHRVCPQPLSAHEPGPPALRVSPSPSASLHMLVLFSFLPISPSFMQLPKRPVSPAGRQPAWPSFRRCHCSAAPFCRAGCLHPQLPPHTRQEDAQSCAESAAQRLSRATSSNYYHHHHRSTLAPRKSKTRGMQFPGSPFLLPCGL